MRNLISIIPIIILIGCFQKSLQNDEARTLGADSLSSIKPENEINKSEWLGDSIATKDGNFHQLIFLDSNNFKIKWGNKEKIYFSEKVFEISGTEFFLDNSSKDAILLSRSCGTWCREGVVLMLRQEDNIKHYRFLMAKDLKNNLVAFTPTESRDTLIRIENFSTGKFKVLSGVDLCPAMFQGECIDSLSFTGKSLYIKWQGSNWTKENSDTRERRIDLSEIISNK